MADQSLRLVIPAGAPSRNSVEFCSTFTPLPEKNSDDSSLELEMDEVDS
jgi:hypothetical protein